MIDIVSGNKPQIPLESISPNNNSIFYFKLNLNGPLLEVCHANIKGVPFIQNVGHDHPNIRILQVYRALFGVLASVFVHAAANDDIREITESPEEEKMWG